MHIRYSNGHALEGVILSLAPNMARVAVRDRDDVAEFRLVAGQWLSEEREPVVFEFLSAPKFQAPVWSEPADLQVGSRYVN